MIYVISDLHGYPLPRFKKLLALAGFSSSDHLFILGDVIDRNGDGGAAMLYWLTFQTNIELILGNHEAMLLSCSFLFDEITEESISSLDDEKIFLLNNYILNGGYDTVNGLKVLSKDQRQAILEYLQDCPIYESVCIDDRDFLLVHSGIDNYTPGKPISEYTEDELLWAWPNLTDEYTDEFMTVFGHTPTSSFGKEYKGKIIKTKTWIDIDVGAGSGEEPILLRLDDMKEFRLTK